MTTIEHSGQKFTQLENGNWPMEEYFARTNHTPQEREMLRVANPDGKAEGAQPNGWDGPIPHKPI